MAGRVKVRLDAEGTLVLWTPYGREEVFDFDALSNEQKKIQVREAVTDLNKTRQTKRYKQLRMDLHE